MAYLWDSNILRHYAAKHPQLLANLERVPRQEVRLPIIVYAEQLKQRIKKHKRHADLIIAAQTLAGRHILVTRNTADFRELLPASQWQNWIDDRLG